MNKAGSCSRSYYLGGGCLRDIGATVTDNVVVTRQGIQLNANIELTDVLNHNIKNCVLK